VSSVDVAAVVAAPAVVDLTGEFCSSPSASVRRSSRTDDGVGTAAQFASRLQELLQPNLAQAALAGDQLVGKFDSAQQASSLDVRVSPPESLVMQPFRRRRLAVGGLPAQQQCSLPLEGARPHFPLSPAELKALDRQIFQLSKEVCDLQAQRQCAVARLCISIALGVLDSMQAMDITWTPSLLEWFSTTMVALQQNEAILLQQVVGEDV